MANPSGDFDAGFGRSGGKRPPGRDLPGGVTAIDREGLTGHERGLIRANEHDGIGDLLWGSHALQDVQRRNGIFHALIITGEAAKHFCFHWPRSDGIDPNSEGCRVHRRRLRDTFDGVLARDVERRARSPDLSKASRNVYNTARPLAFHHPHLVLQPTETPKDITIK